MKCVFFMPRRAASRFIICAKTSSEPDVASARAMQASLPDCTTMPRTSSSTATGRLGSTNMREPGARQARTETVTCCSGEIFFSRSAENTRYAVISLVREAGSMRSSGFSEARICPLERSPMIHDRPMTEGGCGAAAWARVHTKNRTRRMLRMNRTGLAHDKERLDAQLAFDALRHRARVVLRAVRPDVQPPQVADGEHLDGILEPAQFVFQSRAKAFCV